MCSAIALAAGPAGAQQQAAPPLAEVARQAEAAKPTIRKAKKTYTNASLRAVPHDEPTPAAPPPGAGLESKSVGTVVSAGEKIVRSEPKLEQEGVAQQSEANWRNRAASIRKQIGDLEARLSTLTVSNPLTDANPSLKKHQETNVANARQALGKLHQQWATLEASASGAKIPSEWLEPRPQLQQ
ncbi:MAG TPA: hypothetical protein VF491_07655 [Vicinamibacterales bacterium]